MGVGVGRAKSSQPWTSAAARRITETAGVASVHEAVTVVAERLLDGVTCPPTDLRAIAEKLDTGIPNRGELLPVAGELHRNSSDQHKRFEVKYASGLPEGRRRFTIAHELGHAFFEQTGPNCPKHGRELERICDMLAAEILMPRTVFKSLLDEPPTVANLLSSVEQFRVSRSAAAYRCHEISGLHVFEVDASRELQLTTGLVRHVGWELADAVNTALEGDFVESEVLIPRNRYWNGRWFVQGAPVGNRAVFALRPLLAS